MKSMFGLLLGSFCLTAFSAGQELLDPVIYNPATASISMPKVKIARDLSGSTYSVSMQYLAHDNLVISNVSTATVSATDFDSVEYNPATGSVKVPYLRIHGQSPTVTYSAELTANASGFAVASANQVSDTQLKYDVLQTWEANPRLDYTWLAYIPSSISRTTTNYIVVEGSAGLQSDDYSQVVEDAKIAAAYWGPQVGSRGFIYLRPVFPAPAIGVGITNVDDYARYPQGLYRGSLMTSNDFKYRPDLRLNKMIDTLRNELVKQGYPVSEKVFMYGFSISGAFTARYTVLHPDRIKASAPGSPGFMPIPVDSYDGKRVTWPVGVSDIEELTGIRVDLNKLTQIPQLVYIGNADTVDPVPSSNGVTSSSMDEAAFWPTSGTTFMPTQAKFIHDHFGIDQAQRMVASVSYLQSIGLPVTLKTYAGVGHSFTRDMLADVLQFFLSSM